MSPLIELSEIEKVYQMGEVPLTALKGITLSIKKGEFVAIMGASGSGKSTLMNLIGLLDQPTSGSYKLEGKETSTLSQNKMAELRNTKFGFVFQSYNLLPRYTALKNVELPLLYSNSSPSARRKASEECLKRVGLSDRMKHKSNQMSGGEQQRVSIARALVVNPAVLLADEPTGNLDTKTGREILKIFKDLDNGEKTIILVTHDPQVAEICRRIITIQDGEVLSDLSQEPNQHL